MPIRHIYTDNRLNDLSINADNNYPVYLEAVTAMQKRLLYMLEKHSQVFVGHIELRFPEWMPPQNNNTHISNTIRKIKMKFNRENIDIQLAWARERRYSANCHYHCYIICDANRVQHIHRIASFINEIWSREIGCFPESNYARYCLPQDSDCSGIRIIRNSPDVEIQLNNASHWMSYGAKVEETEELTGCRMFGFTQIPK